MGEREFVELDALRNVLLEAEDEKLLQVIRRAIEDAQINGRVEYKRRIGLQARRTMAETILWRLREHASVTSPGSDHA